ncbi:MAG: PKD domain-containing protein [Thermoplasmata archaeon]|nr:PKD domain-containing protein [Thermoplasmata archaeon]
MQLTGLATAPGARTQPEIAYDPSLQEVVMFGGYSAGTGGALGDTWAFVNNSWSDLTGTLSTAPPARWGGTMVWDPKDQYLVMFGGRSSSLFYNDTWTFNGSGWALGSPSSAPQPRAHFTMAWDPVDRYVVLAAGDVLNSGNGSAGWSQYADTWTYVGGAWTNVTNSVVGSIGPRIYGPGVYDPWNRSVVVVDGTPTEGCGKSNPVATYRTAKVWNYPASVGPTDNTSQAMMTYDPQGAFLLNYGGAVGTSGNCAQTNATWVRYNGTWWNVSAWVGQPPSTRYLSGIAFDAVDQEIVLFGGNSNGAYLADTWTYRATPISSTLNATPREGGVPLTVNLSSDAWGGFGGYGYNWSFGDGGTSSTGANTSHTYTALGTYHIWLNWTDRLGRAGSGNLTVSLVPGLFAVASATPTIGSIPLTVNFSATIGGGVQPYNTTWAFGDGSIAYRGNVTHVYLRSGPYRATLTVRDQYGLINRSSILFQVAPRLVAGATATPSAGIAPFNVSFVAAPAGGNPPYAYAWAFGDGGIAITATPTHLYRAVGAYNATVAVQDSLGRSATYAVPIRAYPALVPTISANLSAGVGPLSVEFTAGGSGGDGQFNFSWNFGDRSAPASGGVVDHVFTSPGNYTIQLTLTDLSRASTAQLTVTVVRPLAAVLSATSLTGETGAPFHFVVQVDGGLAPLAYTWNFGDGTSGRGTASQDHTYALPGSFTVRLAVTDAVGERVLVSAGVGVVRALTVALIAESPAVTVGASDNLTATVGGGLSPVAVQWSGLPPGCPASTAASLACSPSSVGNYTITISVVDALGFHAAANVSMTVDRPVPPAASAGLSGTLDLAAAGGAVVAVGLGTVLLLWRRRKPGASSSAVDEVADEPPEST